MICDCFCFCRSAANIGQDRCMEFSSGVTLHHVECPLCHYSLTSMNEAPQ